MNRSRSDIGAVRGKECAELGKDAEPPRRITATKDKTNWDNERPTPDICVCDRNVGVVAAPMKGGVDIILV